MNTVTERAYARAGLLGNPSDGYNGKTISFIVKDYFAEVTLSEADNIQFESFDSDALEFDSFEQFQFQMSGSGYYGGMRLLKAALFQFMQLGPKFGVCSFVPFRISFRSNIPRQVGLAGSSAIVIAALRAMFAWHDAEIEPHLLASMALASEHDLGIAAGLQDRVIQSYEGVVHMDFGEEVTSEQFGLPYGQYSKLDPSLLSNVYIAFSFDASESTEVLHNDLKQKYVSGDSETVQTIAKIGELAELGRQALLDHDSELLAKLIDQNFDCRRSICKLHPAHVRMVETARSSGASAKYCGSGGAIVGTYSDERNWTELHQRLLVIGCTIIKPTIIAPNSGE